MLLTVLSKAPDTARVKQARVEMSSLVTAIESYDQDYSRYPVTHAEQTAAGTNDFTTGLFLAGGPQSFDSNSNVVAILMDLPTFPNGSQTAEFGHVYNSKQVKYLQAKMSGYDPATNDPHPPDGVDNSGTYRDPWGHPYIITMDLSYDDQCRDLVYSLTSVSQNPPSGTSQTGFNGLSSPIPNGAGDNFLYHGKVMVWPAGPDGKYDTLPASGPTAVANKDNVLSWQ